MSNEKGFSLVEVMVALLVCLILFLGMTQTVVLGIDSNMVNVLKSEAINIAEQAMTAAKNDTNPTTNSVDVTRDFRNISGGITFTVDRTITTLTDGPMVITIDLEWTWKGQTHTHSIQSVRRAPDA